MYHLFLAAIIVGEITSFGDAPRETLDPVASMRRLVDLFSNCEFAATCTDEEIESSGVVWSRISDFKGQVCPDALVLQCRDHKNTFKFQGKNVSASTQYFEHRWTRTGPTLAVQLHEMWPMTATDPAKVRVQGIVAYPKSGGDLNIAWGHFGILREISFTNQPGANTPVDMVTEGGRRGYSVRNVDWASADRATNVAYLFVSKEYGSTTVTFSKIDDDWMPAKILIKRSADDRHFPNGNPVKKFFPLSQFSGKLTYPDRVEILYEIEYESLPVVITKTETRFLKNEKCETKSTLLFQQLKAGNINVNSVQRLMLPLPDGTKVHYGDKELAKSAWEMKGNQVVKSDER
jgi:hypothetical protein